MPPANLPSTRPDRRLVLDWTVARTSDDTRFAFFERNRAALLNIVTPRAFADAFGIPLWSARTHPTVHMIANQCWQNGANHWAVGPAPTLLPHGNGALLAAAEVQPGAEVDVAWPTPQGVIPGRIYDAAFEATPGLVYEAQVECEPRQGRVVMLLLLVNEAGTVVASPRVATADAPAVQTLVLRSEVLPGVCFATLLLRLENPGAAVASLTAFATRVMLAKTVADADENLTWTDHA